jgi:hypothetical protein
MARGFVLSLFFVPFVFLVVPFSAQSARNWLGFWKPIHPMDYLSPLMRNGLRQGDFGFVGHRPKTAQNRVLKLDSWLAFTRLVLI